MIVVKLLLVTRWASKGLALLRAISSCADRIPPPVVRRSVSKRAASASARDTSSACAGPGGVPPRYVRELPGAPRAVRRINYGMALYADTSATLDDLREAVATLEETERIARRVFGGGHPLVVSIERELEKSRAALREAPHS